MNTSILFTIIWILTFSSVALSKSSDIDIIYLNDGSIINGVIVEQIPDQFIKLKIADGSVLVFKTSNIARIVKSDSVSQTVGSEIQRHATISSSLFFGAAVPLGDFGATSDEESGFAKPGFCFGLQVTNLMSDNLVVGFHGSYSINSIDKGSLRDFLDLIPTVSINTADYKTLNAMLMLGPGNEHGYLCALAGVSHFTNPKLVLTDGYDDITSKETTDLSFSYGGMVGVRNDNLTLNVRFISMETELDSEILINGALFGSEIIKQRVSLLQIVAGVNF